MAGGWIDCAGVHHGREYTSVNHLQNRAVMRTIPALLLLLLWPHVCSAQSNPILEFTLAPGEDFLNQPVAVDLTGVDYNLDTGTLVLQRVEGRNRTVLPAQFENGITPRLWFLPGGTIRSGEEVHYEVVKVSGVGTVPVMSARTDPHDITIRAGDREVLRYRHAMIEAPPGTDPLYGRTGAYIHPLYSPGGALLTAIQPDDHYHHYGIWNPWAHTVFEGREVDFWNLVLGQGTVKHAGILSLFSGELFAGFRVHHAHVDFSAPGAERTALNEIWDVRGWQVDIDGQPAWLIDFTFTLSCATDSLVELTAFRYGGGIGFRATQEWTNQNSTVLTSEGLTRANADASFARWCLVEGETGLEGRSGIVFMSHPANRAHPEPMRIWPENANSGRGDQFFEFCPIRHETWHLLPGQEYVLRYRTLVFDGEMEADLIDRLWRNYAWPARAEY